MDIQSLYESRDSKLVVVRAIRSIIGRELSADEVSYMVQYMASQSDAFFNRRSLTDVQVITAKQLASVFTDEEQRQRHFNQHDDDFDSDEEPVEDVIRDIQNREMREQDHVEDDAETSVDVQSVLGMNNAYDVARIMNPCALVVEYNTLWVNTRNRGISGDDSVTARKNIRFEFSDSVYVRQGTVNGTNAIKDIVSMEIGTIFIPDVFASHFTAYHQVGLLIQEFREQAGVVNDRVRVHIMFNAEEVSGSGKLKLTPIFEDCATLKFDKPLTTLTSLSFAFSSPFEPVTFGRDRDTISAVSNAAQAIITVPNTHGLSVNSIVYISSVVSDSTADATIMNNLNNVDGVRVVALPSTTTITVAVDTSAVAGTLTYVGAEIVYGEMCFIIPIKFKYLKEKDRKYNYSTSYQA
jgi:hypothetical protein